MSTKIPRWCPFTKFNLATGVLAGVLAFVYTHLDITAATSNTSSVSHACACVAWRWPSSVETHKELCVNMIQFYLVYIWRYSYIYRQMIYTPHPISCGWQTREEWDWLGMWRVWVRRGWFIRSWWGNRRERDHWGDLGVDGLVILGLISRRWDVGMWTGLGWHRIGTGGGRL